MENPGLDDDLRETGEFDSVDAIELLLEIERLLNAELTHEEKQMAMEIRTIRQIIDYVELWQDEEGKWAPAGSLRRPGWGERWRRGANDGTKSRHHRLFGYLAYRSPGRDIVESLRRGISGVMPLREDQLIAKFIHSRVFGTVDYPVDYDFADPSQDDGARVPIMPVR